MSVVHELYKRGRYFVLSQQADSLQGLSPEEKALIGMAFYRIGDITSMADWQRRARRKTTIPGIRLTGRLYVVEGRYWEANKLSKKYPEDPGVFNNIVIAARKDFTTDPKKVFDQFYHKEEVFEKTDKLEFAHLLANVGRLIAVRPFLCHGIPEVRYESAIDLYKESLDIFRGNSGKNENLDHRASVCFYKAVAYQKLKDTPAAARSAHSSLRLWKAQLPLDPANPNFKDKIKGTEAFIQKLKEV